MKLLSVIFFTMLYSQTLFANVSGSDLHNFTPTTNGLDFITVHSSRTLDSGQMNVGLFLTNATNTLAYSLLLTAPSNQSFEAPNDKLLYSNLQLAGGIMTGWDLGVNLSFVNSQDIAQSSFLVTYGDTGINDIQLYSKVRFLKRDSYALATILGIDFDQIKNNPFAGNNSGPSFNLSIAVDTQLAQKWLWAVNLGYRLRQEGTPIPNTGILPMNDQITYSSALAYQVSEDGSSLLSEIYGSYAIEDLPTPIDRQLSNLEFLLGYRWNVMKDFDIHGGLGTEFYNGLGSPDFRVYFGVNGKVNFTDNDPQINPTLPPPQPQEYSDDVDGDGVPNPIDQCPNTPPKIPVNEKGCQQLPQKKADTPVLDSDNDGIQDSDDQCPKTATGVKVNAFGCTIEFF